MNHHNDVLGQLCPPLRREQEKHCPIERKDQRPVLPERAR